MVYTCLEIPIHSLLEVPDEFNTQLHQDPAEPPIGQTLKREKTSNLALKLQVILVLQNL